MQAPQQAIKSLWFRPTELEELYHRWLGRLSVDLSLGMSNGNDTDQDP
jgi:hypothetical protein